MKKNRDMYIDHYFTSPIAVFKNENFELKDHCLKIKDKYPITDHRDWIHNPYNSLSIVEKETGYNSLHDPKFSELTRWVQKCVDDFSQECGYYKMRPKHLWFNVYEKGDSQEFHNHGGCHLSCVYYAEITDGDSRIIFNRTPWAMFPIPVVKPSVSNYDQVRYNVERGMLLVFKSDTMHMVERKVTDDTRISVSYNFISTGETS